MKRKLIISLILYISGIAMGFVLLFPFAREVQISSTFGVFGIIVSAVALIYGVIIMKIREEKSGAMITSTLTPIYKFYLPTFIIEMLVFNTILLTFNTYPGNDTSVFIAVEVMLVFWVILLYPCLKLYQMYLKDGKIVVNNYFNSSVISPREVKKIHRFFIFFFKVKLGKTSFIILPKFSEATNLFITPKSIQVLKNLIYTTPQKQDT